VDPSHFPGLNRLILKQTADEATKICEKCYAAKKKEEVRDRHVLSYIALKLALILCIGGFAVFMIPIYLPAYQSQNIIYLGFLCLACASIITVLVIIRTLCLKRVREGLEENTMRELTEFIKSENLRVYNKLHLELHIGYRYFWLEVRRMLT
jgi:uncharacterized membrane protein YcjF (UPF0283 family)